MKSQLQLAVRKEGQKFFTHKYQGKKILEIILQDFGSCLRQLLVRERIDFTNVFSIRQKDNESLETFQANLRESAKKLQIGRTRVRNGERYFYYKHHEEHRETKKNSAWNTELPKIRACVLVHEKRTRIHHHYLQTEAAYFPNKTCL